MEASTETATVYDFFEANSIRRWSDITEALPGGFAIPHTIDSVTDHLLQHWTFDGAVVPDRGELYMALIAMRNEAAHD